MSLKRFLTGKPGNIKEFAEMVKGKGLPVTVLFYIRREFLLNLSTALHGEIIYSVGSFEKTLTRENIRFAEWWGNSESKEGPFSEIGILGWLKDQSKSNLEYLTNEGISYEIKILNELTTQNQ
jgi:hypothetical protein